MKSSRVFRSLLVGCGLVTLGAPACASNENSVPATSPPSHAVVTVTVIDPATGAVVSEEQTEPAGPSAEVASWDSIKDLDYEMRGAFVAGLQQLEIELGNQLAKLAVQPATSKDPAEIKQRELALRQLEFSRAYFHLMCETVKDATPKTWKQKKDSIGQAWTKIQDNCRKLNSNPPK
jgi:hypothetical protein